MSRKPVARQLPALGDLIPEFSPFEETANKRHLLEVALRRVILQSRTMKGMPFYAMRDVARFFKVSLKSVAVVFKKLEQDGLLTIIRGSQTIIEGKQKHSRHNVKGVIGIPVYLPSFVIGNNPRSFYVRFEEHLRRYGYVANFIFIRSNEAFDSHMADRLLEHNLDILFWLSPSRAPAQVLLTLQDSGVRLVIVGDGQVGLPEQQYRLDLDCGMKEAATGWKKDGIKKVFLITQDPPKYLHAIRRARNAFTGANIAPQLLACSSLQHFFDTIASLPKGPTDGFVFLDHDQYESLCNYDWKTMERLFQSHRCLFAQGPVYHPAFKGQTLKIDTIEHPFDMIAEQVSADIARDKIPSTDQPVQFYARWQPDVNLGDFVREL